MQDPKTPGEWQDAVDMAEGFSLLDSARQYGLVTGGPEIDVDRCEAILQEGRRRGVRPAPDAAERVVAGLLHGQER